MPQCASREALLKLLGDELPEKEASVLAGHVEQCAHCLELLEELSDDSRLRDWARGSLAVQVAGTGDDPVLAQLVGRLREVGPEGFNGPPPDASHSTMFRETIRHGDELKILRLIGRGGMGEVYEAHQPSLGRSVAVKLLPGWLADDPEALERFKREAAVTAQLDHPNIVPIYGFGQWGDRWYYSMKLVRGISLAQLIRWRSGKPVAAKAETRTRANDDTRTSQLPGTWPAELPGADLTPEIRESLRPVCVRYARDPFDFTRDVGWQAARALAYAHRHDRIHRDIKPSNIMIDGHGQVYLIDFGLTRGISQTITQHRAGTLRYMSPEQLDLRELDGRSDVFSLGVTLYELASGESPFADGDRDSATVAACIRNCCTTPLPGEAPITLARSIDRCMQPDRAHRFEDASALAESLASSSHNVGSATARRIRGFRPPFAGLPHRRLLFMAGFLCVASACVWLALPDTNPAGSAARSDSAFSDPTVHEYWRWINTFDIEQPSELVRADQRRQTIWSADPGSGRILINGPGLLLIRLGNASAADYSIQVDMFQEEWLGGTGLFFGYQKARNPGDSSKTQFHEILLARKSNLAAPEPVSLQWRYLDNFNARTLEVAPVSVEFPREHTLEILVRGGKLAQVAWDHQVVFTTEVLGHRFDSRDFVGAFGIKYSGHRTEIRNPRVMFYPKEAQ